MARDAEVALAEKIRTIDKRIGLVLTATAEGISARIKSRYLGGSKTTSRRLRTRTGELERSIVVQPARTSNGETFSELRIEAPYAKLHFGKKGDVTVIHAKGRFMTVPTANAEDSRGVVLGKSTSSRFKNTFISNGKIFGQVGSSGAYQHLFTLRTTVKVPVRIDIQDNLVRPVVRQLETRLSRLLREF